MDGTNEYAKTLEVYLSASRYRDAVELFQDESFIESVKTNSWDFIECLTKFLNEDKFHNFNEQFMCSERLLQHIAAVACPEEVLLEFLEFAEESDNDLRFTCMIEMLKIVLLRLESKKCRGLEWCLNAIQRYFETLPIPKDHLLEKAENILLDNDDVIKRYVLIIESVVNFLQPFVNPSDKIIQKKTILFYCLYFLEKPFPYIYYEAEKIPSKLQSLGYELKSYIQILMKDPFYLLNFARIDESKNDSDLSEEDKLSTEIRIHHKFEYDLSGRSLGMYYYMLFINNDDLSSVYSHQFLFFQISTIAFSLIKMKHNLAIEKGLFLLDNISSFLSNKLGLNDLNHEIHKSIILALINVTIYAQVKLNREISLRLLKKYICLFDDESQYWLLFNMRKDITHSGILGYLIMFIKDKTLVYLDSEMTNKLFMNKVFFDLIWKYCSLIDKEKTDLVTNADQIISAINFYRFVFIRDKNDVLGLKQYLPFVKTNFCNVLTEGVKLSKAHYELALKDCDKFIETNIDVKVDEEKLPNLTKDGKINSLKLSLSAIDLIESLLSVLNECVMNN